MGRAGDDQAGHVGAAGAHEQRGDRLIAAAQQHNAVEGLRADHLLGTHREQVAEEYRGDGRQAPLRL
jgi:hypothetical protein